MLLERLSFGSVSSARKEERARLRLVGFSECEVDVGDGLV